MADSCIRMMLWIFYLLLCGRGMVATDCPKGCKNCRAKDGYYQNIAMVKSSCQHNSWMTEIPRNLPTNMRTLVFKSNAVKTIKTSSLHSFIYLQYLDLTNNGIETIENGSFKQQRYLKALDLSDNRLTNLTFEMFEGLYSLETFILRNNRISGVSRGSFKQMKVLKSLDLHDNLIENIVDGVFDSLVYLKEIHLSGCHLKRLAAGFLGNLMSLKEIDLSFNAIEEIDPDTFSCTPLLEILHLNNNSLKESPIALRKLIFLKELDISKNPLTYIRSKTFTQNERLEKLNVSFCEIGFVQEGAFDGLTSLRKLFVNGNPLHCDCRLSWLSRFWRASGNIFGESGLSNCSSPPSLSTKPLTDITPAELKCNRTTCHQDLKCNRGECASCNGTNLIQSYNCSRPLCHFYDGQCLCSNESSEYKHKEWKCNFQITKDTCNRNASIKPKELKELKGLKELGCVCNAGFRGDGLNCTDIDECASKTKCRTSSKMICINTIGSHECVCQDGYQKKHDAFCVDINECKHNPCVGQADCHNTLGSYSCQCKKGFTNILNDCLPLPNKVHVRVKEVNSSAVLVTWSKIIHNKDTVTAIRIVYRPYGKKSGEWTKAPKVYSPNTTEAVLTNLIPDMPYHVQVELRLIYNITFPSDIEYFQTKERASKGKSSGTNDDEIIIVTSSVVGSAVAIAIVLTLIAFCLKRKKKTVDEGSDNNRPYLQDLIEMRVLNRDVIHENAEELFARMDAWEVPRDRLKVGEKIGEGQFGIVLNGTLTTSEGPVKVAIKTIKSVDRFDMKEFIQEMEMMKEIGHHPNIVSLLGVSSIGAPLYIITEYIDGGNLLDLLRSSRRSDDRYANIASTLNSRELLRIALDVSRGMNHIAVKKLVHRDLAARNVLMTTDLVAKISDFGLARDIYCEGMYVKTGGGRLPIKWMAPDAIRDQTYTIKSDVWSFGILLWEIVTLGGSPYPGIPVNILLEKLLYGYRLPKPDHCSDEVYSIMQDCWSLEPSERPSFDSLCEALSVLLSEEGHIYINIRAVDVDDTGGNIESQNQAIAF